MAQSGLTVLLAIFITFFTSAVIAFIGFVRISTYGFYTYAQHLVAKYVGRAWISVIMIFISLYALFIVLQQYQEPAFQVADQFNDCALSPVNQFGFGFGVTFILPSYDFIVGRWNDLMTGARECFVTLVNLIMNLPSLENLGFYTELGREFVEFFRCLTLLPFDTPSWQLPFGISNVMSFLPRRIWCYLQRFYDFYAGIVDWTLWRNDCQFCEVDPNATCLLRQVPFFLDGHVPPTVGDPNCTGCVQIDCDFIECTILAFANLTAPIQEATGTNFTEFFVEVIPPTCCFITGFYKRPFYLFAGIITLCYDLDPQVIEDFIINDWLNPVADCFLEIFFILSGDTVSNIFIDIFAIIFSFIQVVIDSYLFLVDCFNLHLSCLSSYAGNCVVGANGLATEGLQTCFNDIGVCIVDGEDNIPPNPILSVGSFASFFTTVLPEIFGFVDDLVCQFIPFQRCTFGPDIVVGSGPSAFTITTLPNCKQVSVDDFTTGPTCYMSCLGSQSPIFAPIAAVVNAFLAAISSIIDGINSAIDSIENAGSTINPFFVSNNLYNYGCRNISDTGVIHETIDLTECLHENDISYDTTCGSILYQADLRNISRIEDPLFYLSYFICGSLLRIAQGYDNEYENGININRMLNASTFTDEISNVFKQSHAKKMKEMEQKYGYFSNISSSLGWKFMKEEWANTTFDYSRWKNMKEETRNQIIKVNRLPAKEKNIQVWSELVQSSPVKESTIWSGLIERIVNTEPFQLTRDYVMLYNVIRKEMSKAYRSFPRELREENGTNLMISDLIKPYNPHELKLKRDLESLRTTFENSDTKWGKRMLDIEYQRTKENLYAVYVSSMVNWFQQLFDDKAIELAMKREIRKGNLKRARSIRSRNDSNEFRISKKIYVVTVDELKARNERVTAYWSAFKRLSNSFKNILTAITPGEKVVADIMNTAIIKDNFVYKSYNLLRRTPTNAQGLENITKFFSGDIAYDVDNGYMSHESECELKKKRDNSTLHIFDMVTGTYNWRKPKRYGPFLSDADSLFEIFGYIQSNWRREVKEMKYKKIRKMGLDPTLPENQNLTVSFLNDAANNFIVDVFMWVINGFFSGLSEIFLRFRFHFDLKQVIIDFINSFDVLDIVENVSDRMIGFWEKIMVCNSPEDWDGTNAYKAACIPFLPMGLLNTWMIPVGEGNPYFPLQLGIVPEELISKPCVNHYNGNFLIYGPFRLSDNCGSGDGADRPFCDNPVPCDWCRREYESCSTVRFDTMIESLIYPIGVIPVLMQFFYTGLISSSSLQMFLFFFLIYINGLGGFNLFFFPMFVFPLVEIVVLITNFLDAAFFTLSSDGTEGGLNFGAVYVVILVIITYLAPSIIDELPKAVIAVLGYGLAISWLVNFFVIPFDDIQSNLRLSSWLGLIFECLNEAPQPLVWIDWTRFIEATERFDYSNKPVPYVDTFCFLVNLSNAFLVVGGTFLFIEVVQGGYVFAYPLYIFISQLINAFMVAYTSLKFFINGETQQDILNWKQNYVEDTKHKFNLMKKTIDKETKKIRSLYTRKGNRFSYFPKKKMMG